MVLERSCMGVHLVVVIHGLLYGGMAEMPAQVRHQGSERVPRLHPAVHPVDDEGVAERMDGRHLALPAGEGSMPPFLELAVERRL